MRGVKIAYKKWADTYDRDSLLNPAVQMDEHLILPMLKLKKSDKVLDLGCGTGRWTIPISKKCKNIVGVDMSEEMLAVAKSKSEGLKNLKFVKHNLSRKLPFRNGSFDKVLVRLVVGHIRNVDRFFGEVYRVLKKGGAFVYDDVIDDTKKPFKLKYPNLLKKVHLSGHQVYSFTDIDENVHALHRANFSIEDVKFLRVDERIKGTISKASYEKNKGRTLGVIFKARK